MASSCVYFFLSFLLAFFLAFFLSFLLPSFFLSFLQHGSAQEQYIAHVVAGLLATWLVMAVSVCEVKTNEDHAFRSDSRESVD